MFCCVVFCVLSSLAITLMRKRELFNLLCLSSRCLVTVIALWLLPMAPWVGLQWCMIVVFPDQTHLIFVLFISDIAPVSSLHEHKYKSIALKTVTERQILILILNYCKYQQKPSDCKRIIPPLPTLAQNIS